MPPAAARPGSRASAVLRASPASLSPLLLTCEHASRRLPAGFPADRPSRAILRTHWGSDPGAWAVARAVAADLRATAVGGRWSRLVIDLNRNVDSPTLILPDAGGVALPWNRRLPPSEIERRVMEYHVPYHAEIDRQIVRRVVRGVRPFLLAVHSFTPKLGRSSRRFDAGVLFADHERYARILARALRDQGLSVRYNEPYSGLRDMMYSAQRHGSHHRLPCLELELNQALLATGVGRVAPAVVRAARTLARSWDEDSRGASNRSRSGR